MIVSPPGYWLLQIDYSVLELRTLAQICLHRYGKSVLADLFRQGIDPHEYTASLLMEITLEEFQQLPVAEQKQARQRAKAINFGVPGGLGATSTPSRKSLPVEFGEDTFGVFAVEGPVDFCFLSVPVA
jgi:DNA polymerase I-like protein with 3'-5' exonuclease and polymerase domains